MATLNDYKLIKTSEILEENSLSRTTLYKLVREGRLREGIHYFRQGGNARKSGKTRWNAVLVKNLLINFDDDAHERAVAAYIKAVNSR